MIFFITKCNCITLLRVLDFREAVGYNYHVKLTYNFLTKQGEV